MPRQILDQLWGFFHLPSGIGLQLSIIPSTPLVTLSKPKLGFFISDCYQPFLKSFMPRPPHVAPRGWRSTEAHIHLLQFFCILPPSSSGRLFPASFLPWPSSLSPWSDSYPNVRSMQITHVSRFLYAGSLSPKSGVWSDVSCSLTSWIRSKRSY